LHLLATQDKCFQIDYYCAMNVTLGFVMRIDTPPPAVVVPPLPQPNPIIEAIAADSVPGVAALDGRANGISSRRQGFVYPQPNPSALTYTSHGKGLSSAYAFSGSLIDVFA